MKERINSKIIVNLFYYNLFRFARFTQYLLAYPFYESLKTLGIGEVIEKRSGKPDWDLYLYKVLNNSKSGYSLISAGNYFALLCSAVFVTVLNAICVLFNIKAESFWVCGLIGAMISAFIVSLYGAPSNPRKFHKQFKKFEKMASWKKRLSAFVTFGIVIAILVSFVMSFLIYLPFSLH